MDNLTHAFAGCLIAAGTIALVERKGAPATSGTRQAATLVAIVGAELPDADLLYSGRLLDHGKLGYLLHHRGYTHTILFAIVSALLLWLITLALSRELRSSTVRWPLLGMALVATLSHIALDFTNSYGVHPFWPVQNDWYYGDAVFIVEPWLWIVSLPPLLLAARNRGAQGLFGASLGLILIAAWMIDLVGRGAAISLTVGAVVWLLALRFTAPNRRILSGVIAWCVVEGVFFVASASARDAARSSVSAASFKDVALTPAVGNPLCFRALVVQLEGPTYRVTSATVAPFPMLEDATQCGGRRETPLLRGASPTTPTNALSWDREWSGERSELAQLVAMNCEIRTAMHFMRVPYWEAQADGSIQLYDLRFSSSGGGFAGIATSGRKDRCDWTVPAWTPPRSDVIRNY